MIFFLSDATFLFFDLRITYNQTDTDLSVHIKYDKLSPVLIRAFLLSHDKIDEKEKYFPSQ